jgi:putative ubiquitin-RnfH superfamily antitoxin RatB of RatAB toxin-antitoxin module
MLSSSARKTFMVNSEPGLIEIEVVYALPQLQTVVALTVPPGTTVSQAIIRSGIAARHPEVDPESASAGIFGRRVRNSTVLRAHDRVEIYRPLIADPKQARRRRASKAAKSKR